MAPPADEREAARRRFLAAPDTLAELDLTVDDLADRDIRATVIQHEHPDLADALISHRFGIEDGVRAAT